MHLLVLGSKGQVGRAMVKSVPAHWKVTAWSRDEVDFTQLPQVEASLASLEAKQGVAEIIINAAAYTQVDLAESQPESAQQLNAALPTLLAATAKRWGSKLVHYSTDYVYPGHGVEPYLESDPVGPLSVYGESKLAGDRAIEASGCDYLIFRTSWVYTSMGKNFLLTMLKLASEREVLRVVEDQVGSPTLAEDIAQISMASLTKAMEMQSFPSGVYHLTNSGFTSWHGFAQAIVHQARANGFTVVTQKVEAIPSSAFPTPALRPHNSRLSLDKLKHVFGLSPRSWTEAMIETIAQIKSQNKPQNKF